MKWFVGIWFLAGIYVSTGMAVPMRAQAAEPATQCMYSGFITLEKIFDDPVRFELDADGRGLTFIHKLETSKPFETPTTFAEKPTCRLKLDCVVSRQGLKNIGVQTVEPPQGTLIRKMVWVRIGFSVAFQYDKDEKTCHVVGIEEL